MLTERTYETSELTQTVLNALDNAIKSFYGITASAEDKALLESFRKLKCEIHDKKIDVRLVPREL